MQKPVLLIVAILFFVFTSCATHKPISPPDLDNDLAAQRDKQILDGIEVKALPIHDKSELAVHFDDDLILKGVLPIQVDIENKSGSACAIVVDHATLSGPEGEPFTPLTLDKISSKAGHSYAYAIPWAIGFGLVGGVPSLINVAVVNDSIKKDYDNCMLKDAEMVAGASTVGTLFFPIDSHIESLDDWFFKLGLTRDGQAVDFVFDLHGAVEQPRIRKFKETEDDL